MLLICERKLILANDDQESVYKGTQEAANDAKSSAEESLRVKLTKTDFSN